MMLLSSYEGNHARFSDISFSFLGDKIFITVQLEGAFENDFEEIFKSGQQIDIYFNIEFKNGSDVLYSDEFVHSIIYDPLSKFFDITLEEQKENFSTDSYQQLIEKISQIEYTYENAELENIVVSLESSLKKIRLQSMKKEYDLMMLWKFKKPKTEKHCRKADYES
jgi:hypothetical protein